MGADQEVAAELGGVAGRLGKVLLRSSSGSALVWDVDVGSIGANGAEVRGSECVFPDIGNKVKGKAAEVRVMVEGSVKNSPSGIGDTSDMDLLRQETGNSGGVGDNTAYFQRLCKGDGI